MVMRVCESFISAFNDLDNIGLVWGVSFLVYFFIELPEAFFYAHFEAFGDSVVVAIILVLF
jgi:hypothetical protein